MKIVISFVISLFILNAVSAEDIEIPSQISLFLEAWNQNSLAIAEEVISENYEIPGLPQELSSSVLNQAFAGNSSQVQIISYQGSTEHPSGLKHDLLVQRAGEERTMYFVIDSSGQICESDIFAVEVRRITQEPANAVSDYITLPFELQAHIPIIDCKIGSLNLKMGLDTGAQSNLLDEDFMPQLMDLISNVEADTLMGADAREILIQSGEIPSLIIQDEDFGAMRYAFSDISHLSDAYQVNISGLLGKPLLSQRPFGINYRKRTLKFY